MNTTTNTRGVSEAMYTPEKVEAIAQELYKAPATSMWGSRVSVPTDKAAAAYEALIAYAATLRQNPERRVSPEEVRLSLDYSRNFARANPRLSKTTVEHIEGLCNLVERLAALSAEPAAQGEAVLDADARIGPMVFRKGVRWSTVIGAAQWQFRYHEEDKARCGMRAADLGGPIPESESDALRAVGAPGWDDADEGMAHIPPHAVKVGDDTYAWQDTAPPIDAVLADSIAPEPAAQGDAVAPFIVGNAYRTLAGDLVRFVSVHNEGTSYETMADEDGVHRYTRHDFGRVTGTAHDYSDPRNTPPLYTAPPAQPAERVPEGWRETILGVLSALDVATGDSDPNIGADLTDDDFRDEYPEVWAMQQLSALLAASPAPSEGGEGESRSPFCGLCGGVFAYDTLGKKHCACTTGAAR